MIVILEGHRRAGKSTFASAAEAYGRSSGLQIIVVYERSLQKRLGLNQEQANFVSSMQMLVMAEAIQRENPEAVVIFDRLHISEKVYGKALRGYETRYHEIVDSFAEELKAKVICFESATAESRVKQGERLFREAFYEACISSKLPVTFVNLDEADGKVNEQLVEALLFAINVGE